MFFFSMISSCLFFDYFSVRYVGTTGTARDQLAHSQTRESSDFALPPFLELPNISRRRAAMTPTTFFFLLFHNILNIFELTKRMLRRHTCYVILSTRIRHFFVSHVRYITTRVAKVNRMRRRKNCGYGVDRNARNFQNGRGGGYIIHDFCFTNNTKMNFFKNKTHILVSLLGTLGEI
jgi:hypothetical protein